MYGILFFCKSLGPAQRFLTSSPPPFTSTLPEAFGAACPDRAGPLSALRPCAPAGLSHRAGGAAIAAGEEWPAAGGSRGCAREGPAQTCHLNFPRNPNLRLGTPLPCVVAPFAECVAQRPPHIVIGYSTPAD